MGIVNVIIMTAAISFSGTTNANERRALEYTAKALYKYNKLDKVVKKIEDKYTPDWVKENSWIIYAVKVGTEKKISYQWSF